MNGAALEPEPSGSGPLRLVMPQYAETDVNKPSWVSNVRLIEVGPLERGASQPDAASVPLDQVWLYGATRRPMSFHPGRPFFYSSQQACSWLNTSSIDWQHAASGLTVERRCCSSWRLQRWV